MKNTGHRSAGLRKSAARSTYFPRACLLFLPWLLEVGTLYAVDLNRQVTVDIPAGASLEQTLLDLGVKASTSISFATDKVIGHKTPALQGTFTLATTLTRLFKDTGLSYRIVNDTIYVLPAPTAAEGAQNPSTVTTQTQPPPAPNGLRHRRRHARGSANSEGGDTSMAQVTISSTTGSHLHNSSRPLGTHVLTQPYFERSGFQTVGEVLRALAESFPGGLNPGVISAGGSQNTLSQSGASSANLHGMGSASTLTLVNGHRLATSEGSGAVDVTLIPLSAVDRIEVVTGGAAAVYGSDAVAGVVNIILREDYKGLEMSSALGAATDGGGFLQHYSVLGGEAWENAHAFADVDCAWQHQIDANERTFVPMDSAGTTLLPKSQYCSTVVSATRDLPGNAAASLEGIYTTRVNDASQNRATVSPGVLSATQAQVTQYATIATVRAPLGADWVGVVTSTLSADDAAIPQQLTLNGAAFRSEQRNKFDNRLWSTEINLDGTLLELPTGAVKLAAGAGYNQEDFVFAASIPGQQFWLSQRRRVRFVYTEALVPLLPLDEADVDDAEGFNSLSLRIAGQAAWYSDVGSTVNPKIGLLYHLSPDFGVEASWGTSYRAPTLLQQYNTSQASLQPVPDPTVAAGESVALLLFGGNPHLRPEESSDLTLDFAFKPEFLPGTVFKITLFDIDDRKRIDYPTPNTGNPLSDPNVLPFVTRNPSPATLAQILQQSPLVDVTAGKNTVSDVTLLIDDRNQNITRQRATGIDLVGSKGTDTPIGRLDAYLSLAYLNLRQQVTPESLMLPLSGTIFYPPTWRSRLALNWKEGGYRGALFVNYIGPSRDTGMAPQEPIGSWTTLDASLGYLPPSLGHRTNLKLTLSAQNVLNHRPPFANTNQLGAPNINFDSTNTSAVGRFLTLQVTFVR